MRYCSPLAARAIPEEGSLSKWDPNCFDLARGMDDRQRAQDTVRSIAAELDQECAILKRHWPDGSASIIERDRGDLRMRETDQDRGHGKATWGRPRGVPAAHHEDHWV